MAEEIMDTTHARETEADAAKKSRISAIILAVAGLVGMFLALAGMIGFVKNVGVWGANPVIWLTLGLIIAVAAAIADTVLGAKADFTTGAAATSGNSRVMNRFLPWIIVVLTLIGIAIIAIRG